MKHYDAYGNPTPGHVRLVGRSMEIADKVVHDRWISDIRVAGRPYGGGYRFRVTVGKNGRALPRIDHRTERNRELVDYIADEISVAVPRLMFGWDRTTSTGVRVDHRAKDRLTVSFRTENR